eukprot:m.107308 g.107308  ORF g.107308 m.107308 type:complete len:1346 (+) comp8977_c1_seq1:110-4147(+)
MSRRNLPAPTIEPAAFAQAAAAPDAPADNIPAAAAPVAAPAPAQPVPPIAAAMKAASKFDPIASPDSIPIFFANVHQLFSVAGFPPDQPERYPGSVLFKLLTTACARGDNPATAQFRCRISAALGEYEIDYARAEREINYDRFKRIITDAAFPDEVQTALVQRLNELTSYTRPLFVHQVQRLQECTKQLIFCQRGELVLMQLRLLARRTYPALATTWDIVNDLTPTAAINQFVIKALSMAPPAPSSVSPRPATQQTGNPTNKAPGGEPTCNYCKQPGHTIANCPDPKRRPWHGKPAQAHTMTVGNTPDPIKLSAHEWIIDTGATAHVTGDASRLTNVSQTSHPIPVKFGTSTAMATKIGQGTLKVTIDGGTEVLIVLPAVLVVDGLDKSLLAPQLGAHRWNIITDSDEPYLEVKKNPLGEPLRVILERRNELLISTIKALRMYSGPTRPSQSLSLLHQRMGHLNYADLQKQAKASGVPITNSDIEFCEACATAKSRRAAIPQQAEPRQLTPGELLHADLMCPSNSKTGKEADTNSTKYHLVIIDDATRWIFVYALTKKSEAKDRLANFLGDARRHGIFTPSDTNTSDTATQPRRRTMQMDNDSVLIKDKEFCAALERMRITPRASAPHTPEQNGVAERTNLTLKNMARAMITHGKVTNNQDKLWTAALRHAAYLRNRSPSTALGGASPYSKLYGKEPDISNLRIFGATAYVHISTARTATEPKARVGIYVGENEHNNTHRIAILNTANFHEIDTIHVKFDEGGVITHGIATPTEIDDPSGPVVNPELPTLKPTQPVQHHVLTAEPKNLTQALRHPDAKLYSAAYDAELNALRANDVYELVPLATVPETHNVLTTVTTFRRKLDADGNFIKIKARICVNGSTQIKGVDYSVSYAPVVNTDILRTLLSMATKQNMHIHSIDIKTAFLNGDLTEDVYMHPPQGEQRTDSTTGERLVCKLRKSLYGLRQAPRAWYEKLHGVLVQLGFKRTEVDNSFYVYTSPDINATILLPFHVDDFLVIGPDRQRVEAFIAALSQHFDLEDYGPASEFLGIGIDRDWNAGTLTLSQQRYAEDVLERFQMTDCNPTRTPLAANQVLVAGGTPLPKADHARYREMVGSINYLATMTRPDLSNAVSQLARFLAAPTDDHMAAAKHLLRYLRGTTSYGLRYYCDEREHSNLPSDYHEHLLNGFADANWAADPSDAISTTGYVITLNGGAVAWSAQRQKTVALSTTDAEYMAISETARVMMSIRHILAHVDPNIIAQPSIMWEDNRGVLYQATNPTNSPRTKHLAVRHHYVRERVNSGDLTVMPIPTECQAADGFTKSIGHVALERHLPVFLFSPARMHTPSQ